MKKIIILIILIMTSVSFAVPQMINYRGKIFESGGPVNGNRNFDFQIFDQLTGGVSLWDSGSQSLVVNNGYYNYTFNVMSEMFTNDNLYLEVQVEGTILTPRERFVSVGYAMNADMVDGQHATNLQYWGKNGTNICYTNGHVAIGNNRGNAHALLELGEYGFTPVHPAPLLYGKWDGAETMIELNSTDVAEGILFTGTYESGLVKKMFSSGYSSFLPVGLSLFVKDNQPIVFLNGNPVIEKMRVDISGNVGIGTNAPVEKLHVNGNIRMPVTTPTAGVLYAGGNRFLHNFGTGNSFLGMNAGNLTLTGTYNIGIGDSALNSLTSGNNNVGVGNSALGALTTGQRNTAIGRLAGGLITSGSYNVLMGYDAGRQCLNNNVALGYYAGYNTTGSGNIFLGYAAGYNGDHTNKLYIDNSTTTTPLIWGDFASNIVNINGNLGIGTNAPAERLHVNGNIRMPVTTTTAGILYAGTHRFLHNYGANNVFLGNNSGNLTSSGANANVGIGSYTLDALTSGDFNVGIGYYALSGVESGMGNIGMGYYSLRLVTSGNYNIALGRNSGDSLTSGVGNILMGYSAGQSLDTGAYNVILGHQSGYSSTGSKNIFLGFQAGYNETGDDKLYIDNSKTNNPLIWGDFANDIFKVNGSAVFNETGNANYDFRIEGATIPNLFFVDASVDKITMGTTSPYDSSLLTIVGKIAVDGSYGIEARNSNGVVFKDYNGNSVASFTPTGLRLYKNPGTGSTPSNYIYQGAAGSVSKKYALSVNDTFWVTKYVYFTGLTGTSSYNYLRINTSTGQLYYDSSTKRNKENIRPFSDSFEKILNLEPKIYRDKGSKTTEIGYIAEDIDAMGLKHLDTYDKKGLPNGIHYERVPIYTLEVVKRQEKRINALQQKVEDLSKEINELKALIKNKN